MNIKNKSGPRLDSCGTPDVGKYSTYLNSSYSTNCRWKPYNYYLIQLIIEHDQQEVKNIIYLDTPTSYKGSNNKKGKMQMSPKFPRYFFIFGTLGTNWSDLSHCTLTQVQNFLIIYTFPDSILNSVNMLKKEN